MALPKPLNINDIQPFLANPEQLTEQTIELQLAIANYPATPRNLLKLLANSSDPLVAAAASHHVNWAGEITENWQQIADATLQTLPRGNLVPFAWDVSEIGEYNIAFLK